MINHCKISFHISSTRTKMATDPPKRGPQTRNRAETYILRADFDAYFASDEFQSLVNNAVSTELTRFISSEEFKNMIFFLIFFFNFFFFIVVLCTQV